MRRDQDGALPGKPYRVLFVTSVERDKQTSFAQLSLEEQQIAMLRCRSERLASSAGSFWRKLIRRR